MISLSGGSGVSSGGFHADPDFLYRLAGAFEQAAGQIEQAIETFSSSVLHPTTGTFGLLPAAQDAHRSYVETAQRAREGLKAVHNTLTAELAAALRASAATYVRADDASNPGSGPS
jgi:uncharacterized protein YukE